MIKSPASDGFRSLSDNKTGQSGHLAYENSTQKYRPTRTLAVGTWDASRMYYRVLRGRSRTQTIIPVD